MKMKAKNIVFLLLAVVLATGCDSDMKYKDYGVTAVTGLLAPADSYYAELQAGAGKTITFSWEAAQTENGITPIYEVVFYATPGGNELYRHDAGAKTTTVITHKDINSIASLAGIEAGQDGDLYWTVIANNGIIQGVSDEYRRLVITRLMGFSNIPEQLYIYGSATEAEDLGEEMLEMKSTSSDGGEFEIYTRLYAGGTYNFIGSNGVTYSVAGDIMEESSNPISAPQEGIYRITIDMNTKSLKLTRITQVQYVFSARTADNENAVYQGNGVWKVSNKYVEFHQESWGRDERFCFHATVEGEEWSVEIWGSRNSNNDSRSGSLTGDFWNVAITPYVGLSVYDYSWKFTEAVDYSTVDITLSMTATLDNYYCLVEILD